MPVEIDWYLQGFWRKNNYYTSTASQAIICEGILKHTCTSKIKNHH